MKPFILFAGSDYYPCGGWEDYVDSFLTVESALEGAANTSGDWWHIVDVRTGEIVKERKHSLY